MALSTYTGLTAALASLLDRADLTDQIPDFITLFEADFDADPRTARHRRRICRSSSEIDGEYGGLASNYLSVQSAALRTDPIIWLQYIDPDSLVRLKQDEDAWQALQLTEFATTSAAPKFYSVVGREIRFFPPPTETYTLDLTVYERLPALGEDNDDNWLLTYFPQVYLYGSALHSAPFLREDERLPMWKTFYDEGVEKLLRSDPVATVKLPLRTELVGLTGSLTRGAFR